MPCGQSHLPTCLPTYVRTYLPKYIHYTAFEHVTIHYNAIQYNKIQRYTIQCKIRCKIQNAKYKIQCKVQYRLNNTHIPTLHKLRMLQLHPWQITNKISQYTCRHDSIMRQLANLKYKLACSSHYSFWARSGIWLLWHCWNFQPCKLTADLASEEASCIGPNPQ